MDCFSQQLQEDHQTSGCWKHQWSLPAGPGRRRNQNIPEIPVVLHAFKAWAQQALGGKQANKKVHDPYFGKNIVVR